MEIQELESLPMTRLEWGLKECLLQRPDIRSHILSVGELAEYTGWMAREFGGGLASEERAGLLSGLRSDAQGPIMDVGRRLLDDPADPGALRLLSTHWGDQREASYIHPDQDISARQMMRYMPAHWHQNQYFEIYYAFSGECPVHFANEAVTLRPGTVLIVAPNVLHANPCYGDDQVLVYYNIRSSTFDQVFWNQIPAGNLMSSFFRHALSGSQPNSYLRFETGGDPEIRDLLGRVFLEYLEDQAYTAPLINAYMTACFILLLRRYEGSVRLPRSEDFFWKHEYSAILSYIQAHYATVRLSDLAERFHYSEKQIRRIVSSATGMPYSDLITKLRMERSALLLRHGGIAMEAIAAETGYTTVSSFYRAFSAYYGCTPGAYRRGHRGE
ncbi:MAG: helix-turn-helix domain-containing protein [Oscillospiraceae bacterium]|nr:helix-turn-helix domain-containing protein [Oscillospiraceae bacterium]